MIDDTKRTEGADVVGPDTEKSDEDRAAANAAGAAASATADGETTALTAEIAELKDRLLRAHAEMDNIRKRSEREKADTQKYAVSRFAHDILTVGDNFQRAIDAVPAQAAEQDPALKSFLEGVTMTERELIKVLDRHGIKRMQPQGEAFNPHQHQAVMEAQNPDVPAGTVVQVLQAGYMILDRVLRPAMVVVAKGGPKPAAAEGSAAGVPPAANDDAPPSGQSDGEPPEPGGGQEP
jgi:molecular chaperone GrpE